MNSFSKREWLNSVGHPSTGSVVAYHGEASWISDGKKEIMTILEIADCHNKVRLHRAEIDSLEDFINKMEKLRNVIDEFILYLRNSPCP